MRAVVAWWLAATGVWAQTGGLTLADAVKMALERHPDVGKAKAAAEVLRGKITEVRAQALPEVNINGGGLRARDPSFLNSSSLDKFPAELREAMVAVGTNMFSYGVSVKQPLYTAGKVGAALRLAKVEAEGSLADIDRAEQTLALDVVRGYYALLWAERYRGLVLETQRQRAMHADMARSRYENGVVTEVDVLRSEVAVANGKPDVVRAENSIRQGRALLNYYLVEPMDAPTKLAGDFVEKAWEEWNFELLSGEAMRKRPELVRLRIAERSSATLLTLARAESRFRADFNTEFGIMSRLTSNLFNSTFTRWSYGVNVTLPVFDGFRRSGMVYQATANQRTAKLEREKTEQQIRLALQQALDEIRATQETMEAARANIRQAERVLEMTQNNYKFGAATTLDIMDAQTALLVARTNLLRGLHDYSVARASLRWTVGRACWE